ncbi:crossover junction endonuclease MUS81 [Vidua macroura]|uniref:crossover junction endonuclease MUS81 n=1 Tax=Vidua macroura TaxID=187451 RepID=UPI0023A88323|nr:crossover junction endonuclease MUS81 [Vidua macroura]
MAAAAAASLPAPPPPPRPTPTPLFARWLREWRDEAQGTWARGTYERALRSLSPVPAPRSVPAAPPPSCSTLAPPSAPASTNG